MGKTYTGIDIGANSIKLAVSDGDTIKNIVTETLPEGLMAEGTVVSYDAMADFIKKTVSSVGGVAKDVALVLPSTLSLTRRLRIPAMTLRELDLNLPYEFRDYIAQGKDKYLYDYAVLSTEYNSDGTPESMELLAVAATKQLIEDCRGMFRRAGLRLRVALPAAAALQNLMGESSLALANCCVIDFSHRATKLHFFANGSYDVTRIVEIGGADIDNVIAQECGVDVHIANSYKLANYEQVQTSVVAKDIYEAIAVEIGRALNFYSFNNPDTIVEAAYYCGGGAEIPALIDAVSSQTEIELQNIATIMPAAQNKSELRMLCPASVGATME